MTGIVREKEGMRFRARVRAQGRSWRPRTSGTMLLEVFAGKGELTQAFKDKGITTLARIDIEGEGALHLNLLLKSDQDKLLDVIIKHNFHDVHLGTPCLSFSRALGPHLKRSKRYPLGFGNDAKTDVKIKNGNEFVRNTG